MAASESQFDYKKDRLTVLCVRAPISQELTKELEQRGLAPRPASIPIAAVDMSLCRALLFQFDSAHPDAIIDEIKATHPEAVSHGATRIALVENQNDLRTLQGMLAVVAEAADVKEIFLTEFPHKVAEYLARLVVGPSENPDLDIQGAKSKDAERALLLRRAFHDCKIIEVQPLIPGFSTDSVLCVHAQLLRSNAGPRPLPFFIKIDELKKVDEEYRRYQEFVRFFVPFNLRPDFDTGRRVSGATLSVLVSNFVEDAESLLQVVDRGHGGQALHSLFENAMRGWRLQGTSQAGNCVKEALSHFKWREPCPEVVAHAKTLGSSRSTADIMALLETHCPANYFQAPMHGDLHARNVQVHGFDAILIDFLYTARGPMLWDHAQLDVSLMFDPPNADFKWDSAWDAVVAAAYKPEAMKHVPTPKHRTELGFHRLMAARKVRHHALVEQASDYEYIALVALQLLKRSGYYDGSQDIQPYARAFALADILAGALP